MTDGQSPITDSHHDDVQATVATPIKDGEMLALLNWLCTFSSKAIQNVFDENQVDLDHGGAGVIDQRISVWLNNKDIAL